VETRAYLEELRRSGDLLAIAAVGRLDEPVPDCPDWVVRDLVTHAGNVFRFWADITREGGAGPPSRPDHGGAGSGAPGPDELDPDDLLAWYRAGLDDLVDTLGAADPVDACWNWSGADQTAGWVQRRMALEAAVHGWDGQAAAAAAGGPPPEPIPGAVALDGIDEYLTVFRWAWSHHLDDGVTIHLHVTDQAPDENAGAGEWLIRADGDEIVVEATHAKGDLAVRGSASDLFLFLWGRQRGTPQRFGDESLVAAISGGV
jgi:uncharacterized protein (TIGR03083 family)